MNPIKRTVLSLIVGNSHFGAELIARARNLGFLRYGPSVKESAYFDDASMTAHIATLREFFKICSDKPVSSVLAPFDIGLSLGTGEKERHDTFCTAVVRAGIAVWRLDHLFQGHTFDELQVSATDGHPNVYAHELVGRELARRVLDTLRP